MEEVRVQDPISLASDAEGNVYLAQLTAGLVSKIGPNGAVTIVVGNPVGTGISGDSALDVAIPAPLAIELDSAGNMYVLESAGLLWRAARWRSVVEPRYRPRAGVPESECGREPARTSAVADLDRRRCR